MMEYKKILILGGTGLVGKHICKNLISKNIPEIILVSLGTKDDVEVLEDIKKNNKNTNIIFETGNIFFPLSIKQKTITEIEQEINLKTILETFLFTQEITKTVEESFLFYLINRYKPEAIIDCTNSASQLAYSQLFKNYDPLTILIRHIQIMYYIFLHHKGIIKYYLKIGTTGTGGMGLNIPYTHGETQPSFELLLKSSLAGAYTQLLFLMSRTPNMPIICELKPAAAIAWGKISYGPVKKGSKQINWDQNKIILNIDTLDSSSFSDKPDLKSDKLIEAPYVDSGENGLFALEEFRTLTNIGQMEYLHPNDIANIVWHELTGYPTGYNILSSLSNSVLGPSYRAGYFRHQVIHQLESLSQQYNFPSIAFELLGPPKLSKLLFEAYLFCSACYPLSYLVKSPTDIAQKIMTFLNNNPQIERLILSLGIPILLNDGKTLYRGSVIKIKPKNINELDNAAKEGWVDLRNENIKLWIKRVEKYLLIQNTSNNIKPGDLVAFIFEHEFKGFRII